MAYHKSIFTGIILTVLFFFNVSTGIGQAVKTDINTNHILIGERIYYELSVNLANSSYKIDFGIPDSIPHFDIIDQNKYDTTDKQGVYTLKQKIVFTSFDSGVWRFPSFPVTISYANKAPQRFYSDSFLVQVNYSPADSSGQLRDIKPVMEVFVIDRTWMYIAAGIILVLLLAWLIYRYFKNRKPRPKPLFKSSLSAYDEAIKALKALQKQSVNDTHSAKLFYTSLGDIFKKYYSRKLNRNLMSDTTGDVLLSLQAHINKMETLSMAAEALRMADAVKFAKYVPLPPENDRAINLVKETIDQLEKSSTLKTNTV